MNLDWTLEPDDDELVEMIVTILGQIKELDLVRKSKNDLYETLFEEAMKRGLNTKLADRLYDGTAKNE